MAAPFSGETRHEPAFLSLAAAAVAFLPGALFSWDWMRWPGILFALVQGFVLVLAASADFTPFSPVQMIMPPAWVWCWGLRSKS